MARPIWDLGLRLKRVRQGLHLENLIGFSRILWEAARISIFQMQEPEEILQTGVPEWGLSPTFVFVCSPSLESPK